VISGFDTAYTAYNQFQASIERYWTLRHLQQQGLAELDAAVMKDGFVRAESLPLVLRAPGSEGMPRGARVRVRLSGIDLLTLDVHAAFAGRLDDASTRADSAPPPDEPEDEAEETAAPLALAIEVDDGDNPAEPAAPAAAG